MAKEYSSSYEDRDSELQEINPFFRDKYIVSLSSYDIVSKTDNAIRGGNKIFVDKNRDSLKYYIQFSIINKKTYKSYQSSSNIILLVIDIVDMNRCKWNKKQQNSNGENWLGGFRYRTSSVKDDLKKPIEFSEC